MYQMYDRLGEISESANRMGIFLAEQKAGESVTEASFQSRDLLDFHRKGAGKIAQVLVQTVPFLNARLQGLDKMGRAATKENKKRFWMAAGMMTAASIALHFWNEDNDEYKKLSDWEKIAYWHFYIGDQHFRIPTPFEVGAIFGAIPLAITEAIRGDRTMKELGTLAFSILANTFAFNPLPQWAKPYVEQIVNFDFFRWQPIDSQKDVRVEPELRYGPSTGPTAKLLGKYAPKWANASPKRIEKFVRDVLGGFGDGVMGLLDMATQYAVPGTDPAGTHLDTLLYMSGLEGFWPSAKASKEPSYTKYTNKYYDLMAEANMAMNSMRVHNQRSTDAEIAKKEVEFQKGEAIARVLKSYRKQLTNVNRDINMLRFQKMSAKALRQEKNRLLKERNDIYMEAVLEAREEIKREGF
jgi:hypothetical protein